MKVGILCTHPIQYFAPLFRHLTEREETKLTVYYCHRPTPEQQGAGFGIPFAWDVDLASGYRHAFLDNVSRKPGLLNFWGCDTPEIYRIIETEKFDAFLTFGWYTKSMWQAMLACWRSGTPLLVRGDSHLHVEMKQSKRKFKDAIYPVFVRRFSACLAVGKWSEEYFAHYGARRIVRSPHFVDNGWFAERAEKVKPFVPQLRSEWNIPAEAIVFLFAGKFEEQKRPMDLLQALDRLLRGGIAREAVHLLMVGDGALKAACTEFALERSLPATFAGFVNQTEMPKAYAISDVLVLPSRRETWGLVVNEAMACGLPAIVSDRVGCGPDLIRPGMTGHVFPCGEVDALAGKMEGIIRRKSAVKMGEEARHHVADFSVVRAAEGILKAVEGARNDPR